MSSCYTISITLMLLSFLSCTRERSGAPGEEMSCVSFIAAYGEGTRASGMTGYENDISSLDVMVFRCGSGFLECNGRSNSSEVCVTVPRGIAFTYYVFANAPAGAFCGIRTESQLLGAETFLAHNSTSGFVMYGYGVGTFSEPVYEDVKVNLERYACKVTLDCVAPAFKAEENRNVRFRGAFLMNVCGSEPWSGTASLGDMRYNWHLEDMCLTTPVKDFISIDSDIEVTDVTELELDYSFYCLPNPTLSGPDVTRLVLSFSVGGNMDYYPIDIPSMESGLWYCIRNVTLNGPGSSDPNETVTRTDASFSVEITPWEDEVRECDFE